jgi:hypothetical protein
MLGISLSGKSRGWLFGSLLAAVAAVPLAPRAQGALLTVDSVTTVPGAGTASSTSVYGADDNKYFDDGTLYNVNWMGGQQVINTISAGGQTYNFITPADQVTIRTNTSNTKSPDNQMIWYQGSVSGTNINLRGTRYNSLSQTLRSNDVLAGVDNLFTNWAGGNGNNTRTERLDVVFSDGVTAAPNRLFGVFERGKKNQHDPFKIAAITSIDADGNPTGYSDVLAVAKGWGKASVLGSTITTIILRNSGSNANLTSPSAIVPQPVGGVLIPLTDLVGEGVTIYGYSLFAYDVTGNGNDLLDWNSFNKKTHHQKGGLDLLGFTGLVSLNAIPEPAALSLLGLAGLALLRRRRA